MTVSLGDLRDTDSLGRYITVVNKAIGASSAIAAGRLVKITESTGAGAIATAGDSGPFGVVPNIYPLNQDADPTATIVRGNGCEVYMETSGVLKAHQEVVADTGGRVKAKAAEAAGLVVGEYLGKEGESRAHGKPITDAAATNIVCVRLKQGAQ